MSSERSDLERQLKGIGQDDLEELTPLEIQVFKIISDNYLSDGPPMGNKQISRVIGGGVSRKRVKRARARIRNKFDVPRSFF